MTLRRQRFCPTSALGAALVPLVAGPLAAREVPVPQTRPPQAPANVLAERPQRFTPVWSAGGIVAAEQREAMAVGAAVLRRGGNAVDAAVATAFAQAVTLPYAGNLGGGGFLVLWLPGPSPAAARGCPVAERRVGRGIATVVNFRETAPRSARAALFLAPDGTVDRSLATRSLRATAVPGSVAGLLLAQRCYGRLPRQAVLAPAIRLAQQGFTVDRSLSASLQDAASVLADDPGSRRLFFRPARSGGPSGASPGASPVPLQPGDHLRQPELAATLARLAAAGEAGFYEGPVAEALLALMRQRGGLIEAADLRAYRAELVAPLAIRFRDHLVLAPPPPAGGLSLLQLLRLVEPTPLATADLPLNGAAGLHLLVEAMAVVFRDRNTWLGDPAQTPIPIERLLSDAYLARERGGIDPQRHRPPAALLRAGAQEGSNTTHLSVADRHGALVALTTTLNLPYGNGVLVPGAGFLLNNEMDDFTLQLGSANAFGLVQGAANRLAPGRRPLSSMTPTLVFRPDGEPWLATGSPGGSRIITAVAQVLLQRLAGLNLSGAVNAPRLHYQLQPDRLDLEEGFSADTLRLLAERGHSLRRSAVMGATNSVEVLRGGGSLGTVDPRRGDSPATPE
ncbi:MAG: gamma-glutamyltransferase [Synechococcaceae cyanobacterium]|nr:gamma-glutamyltransferase [Synechococcaceae cyanobacterium]